MTICDVHDDIKAISSKMAKLIDVIESQLIRLDDDRVQRILDDISDLEFENNYLPRKIDEAKEMGQKMEDRLSEYRRSIEDLGFKRVK